MSGLLLSRITPTSPSNRSSGCSSPIIIPISSPRGVKAPREYTCEREGLSVCLSVVVTVYLCDRLRTATLGPLAIGDFAQVLSWRYRWVVVRSVHVDSLCCQRIAAVLAHTKFTVLILCVTNLRKCARLQVNYTCHMCQATSELHMSHVPGYK